MSENWRQSEICILINDKSQGCTAKHLSCDGLLHYKFIIQVASNWWTFGEVTGKMVDCAYFTRHVQGVVGYLNMSLLQIYRWVCQWMNFEYRLTFGEVMGKSLVSCFLTHGVHLLSSLIFNLLSATICDSIRIAWTVWTFRYLPNYTHPLIRLIIRTWVSRWLARSRSANILNMLRRLLDGRRERNYHH